MIDEKYTEECRHECKDMKDYKETIEKILGSDIVKAFTESELDKWGNEVKECEQNCKEGNLSPLLLKLFNLGYYGIIKFASAPTFAKWRRNPNN